MNLESINKWLDEEYGCSYTKLEELHDWLVEKNIKLRDENQQLKNALDEIENILIVCGEMACYTKSRCLFEEDIDDILEIIKKAKEEIRIMDKETIEKFDKEQLDILLNDLQDIDKFTGFEDGAFKYELGKYQANLLINCIKKQKEVIDKLEKYIEKETRIYGLSMPIELGTHFDNILGILKEVK